MNRLKLLRSQKGFTLIELLIVMVIIGLLALLVVNQFSSARDDADDTQVKSDVTQLSEKIELYYTENGYYPTTASMDTAAEMEVTIDVKADTTVDPDDAVYTYTAAPAGCDNTATDCDSFTISGTLADGTAFSKSD